MTDALVKPKAKSFWKCNGLWRHGSFWTTNLIIPIPLPSFAVLHDASSFDRSRPPSALRLHVVASGAHPRSPPSSAPCALSRPTSRVCPLASHRRRTPPARPRTCLRPPASPPRCRRTSAHSRRSACPARRRWARRDACIRWAYSSRGWRCPRTTSISAPIASARQRPHGMRRWWLPRRQTPR